MRIIPLKPGDEHLLIKATLLFNDANISHETAESLLADKTYVMLVALDHAGAILGRIYGNVLSRHEATDLLLYEVDVLESHQRRGVGKAMVDFAAALCAELNCDEMWVLTDLDNRAGNALYASAGGKLEGSPANMYVFAPRKSS